VLLTYLAVVSTYVPSILRGVEQPAAEVAPAEEAEGGVPPPSAAAPDPGPPVPRAIALPIAIVLALFAPLLLLVDGEILGLIIIAFALFEAWKVNAITTGTLAGPFPAPTPVPVEDPPD